VVIKDGIRFVDVGEGNTLTGMAIVSVPACPDANALDMVAEAGEQTNANEVNGTMPNDEEKVTEEVIAETQEENLEEPKEEKEEVSTAETAEAEVVHESIEVRESVNYDEFDGKTYHAVTTEHTVVETVDPEPQAAPGPVIAEEKQEDERDQVIAELKARVAELEVAEAE